MAHYRCRIATPMSAADAFDYMADVRNFEQWDPGVVSAVQVEGDGPGPDATYDLLTSNGGRENLFRYEVTEYRHPEHFTIVGKKAPFTSVDVIDVEVSDNRTIVTYDAVLTVPFPLSLGDRWLQGVFDRIGDAAASGLAKVLNGEWLR
jgi:hypothetical protein